MLIYLSIDRFLKKMICGGLGAKGEGSEIVQITSKEYEKYRTIREKS